MKIFKTVKAIRHYLQSEKKMKIGYVPTMGALHAGHLSLIRLARSHSDICVSSIYVNPTQFNEASDLKHYPRTFERDVQKLIEFRNEVLFFPTDKEIYPDGQDKKINIDMGILGSIMEAKFRPGHFEGMLQVVHRLLEIIEPDCLIMGQKDIQQARIVELMLSRYFPEVELIIGPIVREIDGLAMSSRNKRLQPLIRDRASILYKTLKWATEAIDSLPIQQIKAEALERLSIPDFRPEYFEIVNAENLYPVNTVKGDINILACTAVWAGEIRLIDNMYLQKKL